MKIIDNELLESGYGHGKLQLPETLLKLLLLLLFYKVKGYPSDHFRSHLANLPGSKHCIPKSLRGQKSLSKEPERSKKMKLYSSHIKGRNKALALHCWIELVHFTPFKIRQLKETAGPRVAFCSHKRVS